MSITNEEKVHGVVLQRLWYALSEELPSAHFHIDKGLSRSSYTLKGIIPARIGRGKEAKAGLFIKYATDRVSPWSYSFLQYHQDEIRQLYQECGELFVAFVAGDDGIAGINFANLKRLLDDNHEAQEWVRVSRKPRHNYRISGNDGKLDSPLPRNSFPGLAVEYFRSAFQL